MAYHYPYITGWYNHPLSTLTNRSEMITAAVISNKGLPGRTAVPANLVANV